MKDMAVIPAEVIENSIYLIRGHKVMLDMDLAGLYGVLTKYLNQQVGRNIKRFPEDFMFQLNREEAENLRLQNATSRWGGRRYLPLAFTEQGVAMLSSVLNSKRAVQVNIQIMRAFVKIRQTISGNKELAHKLEQLERKVGKNSEDIRLIFQAIRQLMQPTTRTGKIGFLK